MSLYTSLFTGTTGLDANSEDLSVIGNNISNSNTIGFKEGRAAFENALSQTLIGEQGQIGLGTQVETVQQMMTQGSLSNTGNATDMAIQGNGFFMVSGSYNGTQGQFYTRAGQFTVDQNGYLTNLGGLQVQGYPADATGAVGATLGSLQVGDSTSPPLATANVTVKANLQADATIPAAWSAANATGTSNFSTTVNVYDSLGKSHEVDVYYRKTGAGTWEWHALTDGGGLQGGTAGTPTEIASGTLAFDSSGKLSAVTQTSNFNPVGAVQPQALNFNFGDPTGTGGTGLLGVTQFASPSAVSFINQDGYASGALASISVDGKGDISGSFTNGQTRVLGQVAIATFASPDKLESLGGNLFGQMPDSGPATAGAPSSAGRGSVVAGALEQSNVDLATEFVNMIAAQRGFEANSKTVQTADQLLSELIALKR